MDQNELKRLVGKAALNYVKDGDVLGVGTGSTVNWVSRSSTFPKSRKSAFMWTVPMKSTMTSK